ncbi:DNA (cytosine-5)-methyltransferase DRM2-like [Dendrobium catenatum]|uniref:DNA (cytosine-5)-methyltransferase DRM2-like n=1 Tax=Dendrobium catenatum TaxID=906689 RepID=UPI00109FAEBB|nr:DNA (cytosine-5)-methyltransferase DRM2-like [Dendrobium catenatum]
MGKGVVGGLNGEGNGRRQGLYASVLELADSIHAVQMAQKSRGIVSGSPIIKKQQDEATFHSTSRKKKRLIEEKCKHRMNRHHGSLRREYLKKAVLNADNIPMEIPKPMINFSLPFEKCIKRRNLPYSALGPPYFYYENVALAPKGVWDTISRLLYDIEPKFIDSKYFCTAMRKSAYIHNLPIENRFPLLPLPRKMIQEVLPNTKKWWPKWDNRTQLNFFADLHC